jgi:hypothetical protein
VTHSRRVVARQREVKLVTVHALDCPTIIEVCVATKHVTPKPQDERCFLLESPGII